MKASLVSETKQRLMYDSLPAANMAEAESSDSVVHDSKGMWRWISGGAVIASMCCLPSVVLVMFGLASISTAAALSNEMYFGPARYIFYALALGFLAFGLWRYFRQQGICTLDEAKRQRRRVINTSLLVFTIAIITYLIFNYVILEILGIAVGLPWEEAAFWN